jgi:uncharacterized membrane protein YgcG
MADREDYGSKAQKLLPLSSNPRFSWMEWKAYLLIFVATIVLGKEALLTNFAALVETAAQKTARIAKFAVANAQVVFAICQSARDCDEARAVVTAHQYTDPEGNAHTLYKLIEGRFTQKALQTLQKLLVELNQLVCKAGETPAQLIDRFNKITLGVTAIDAAQMPTEIQLIAILKNSISGTYKLLHVMLEVMVGLTLPQLKERFLNWEPKHEVGGSAETTVVRSVANFAGSGLDNRRKKAFVKKTKAGYDNGGTFTMECWNCGLSGHLKRDCPQPDNSESNPGGKRKGGGSGYESGGGGASNSENFKNARRGPRGSGAGEKEEIRQQTQINFEKVK